MQNNNHHNIPLRSRAFISHTTTRPHSQHAYHTVRTTIQFDSTLCVDCSCPYIWIAVLTVHHVFLQERRWTVWNALDFGVVWGSSVRPMTSGEMLTESIAVFRLATHPHGTCHSLMIHLGVNTSLRTRSEEAKQTLVGLLRVCICCLPFLFCDECYHWNYRRSVKR